jgi:beta-lactamase superfamily II metal-dependent hydrolase
VLLPKKEDKDIENNNSVVLAGFIDGVKYAFMADTEKAREKELIKNKQIANCDVIKVGHHGLDTSTTDELIKVTNPKIAVITCDGGESPNNSVVDKLSENGAAIFRTDMHGNIIIKGHPEDKAVEITTNKMIK